MILCRRIERGRDPRLPVRNSQTRSLRALLQPHRPGTLHIILVSPPLVSRNERKSLSGSWSDVRFKRQRMAVISSEHGSHSQRPSTRYSRNSPRCKFTIRNDRISILVRTRRYVKGSEGTSDRQEQDSYSKVFSGANPRNSRVI